MSCLIIEEVCLPGITAPFLQLSSCRVYSEEIDTCTNAAAMDGANIHYIHTRFASSSGRVGVGS